MFFFVLEFDFHFLCSFVYCLKKKQPDNHFLKSVKDVTVSRVAEPEYIQGSAAEPF